MFAVAVAWAFTGAASAQPLLNHLPACDGAQMTVRGGHGGMVNVHCTDEDNDVLTYRIASGPAHGTASFSTSGALSYTAASGYAGPDSVAFAASDDQGSSAQATLSITVDAQHVPVCQGEQITVTSPRNRVFFPRCSDADADDHLSYVIVEAPSHGTAEAGGSAINYTTTVEYQGTDRFTFRATDGLDASNTVTVDVTVAAPSGPDCSRVHTDATTVEDDGTDYLLTLSCSPGDDGLPINYVIDSAPAHGTLTAQTRSNNISQSYKYRPVAGYRGPDPFTWHAVGPQGLRSATQTWSQSVVDVPANHPPEQCGGLGYQPRVHAGRTLHFRVTCFDADQDVLTAEVITAPAHGTLTLAPSSCCGDGYAHVDYQPDVSYAGVDRIALRLSDGRGGYGDVLSVDVIVEDPSYNRAPGWCFAPSPAEERIEPGQQAIIEHLCGDADGDELTYRITAPPLYGTLDETSPGVFRYTPDPGFTGYDSFLYKASDGYVEIREQTRQISVGVDPNAGDAPPRTGEPGGVEPTYPFANAPPGGGGGGSGGGATTPGPTAGSAATPGAAPPAAPPSTAPHTTSPSSTVAPSGRNAGLALGDAIATLSGAAADGTLKLAPSAPTPVLVLICADRCSVRAMPTISLTTSSRSRAAAAATRTLKLAASLLQLAPGHRGTVRIKLTAAQRRAVRGARTARLRVVVRVRHANGVTRSDTLRMRIKFRR